MDEEPSKSEFVELPVDELVLEEDPTWEVGIEADEELAVEELRTDVELIVEELRAEVELTVEELRDEENMTSEELCDEELAIYEELPTKLDPDKWRLREDELLDIDAELVA
ncbi:hypothetical protein EJ06DRAFT_556736 [Trichodelitschia bisporula]|uniref:Uncharacterized protein n=1 Tax=Trichodelitschia bisporula TaxID=703511 RepID=A0A6G1HWJ6_9PEZI|nr:hypothetical protein EJ06DRAFT_556736 [Trichodelitschia bisporula]